MQDAKAAQAVGQGGQRREGQRCVDCTISAPNCAPAGSPAATEYQSPASMIRAGRFPSFGWSKKCRLDHLIRLSWFAKMENPSPL